MEKHSSTQNSGDYIKTPKEKRFLSVLVLAIAINIIFAVISISVGRFSISLQNIFLFFLGRLKGVEQSVILDVRLPRVIGALLIGATLSQTGAIYQGIFNNPLVSSYILNVCI
jgi:ABC-type enterobactin transport system, permease component